MKNKAMVLLFVCVGFLLAGVMGWWLAEFRLSSDQRTHRAMDRDMLLFNILARTGSKMPGAWLRHKFDRGAYDFIEDLEAKRQELVKSGYLITDHITITNLPAHLTNDALLSAEISRRLQADGKVTEYSFWCYALTHSNGVMEVCCRPDQLSNIVFAANQP